MKVKNTSHSEVTIYDPSIPAFMPEEVRDIDDDLARILVETRNYFEYVDDEKSSVKKKEIEKDLPSFNLD